MKKVTNLIVILFWAQALQSCQRELKTPEYVHYVQQPENGLRKVVSADNWDYIIQYRPYDYILLSEQKKQDPKQETKRLNDLKGTAWFTISFKRSDGSISPMRYNLSSREEYEQRQNYFLNKASKDIVMVYGKKDTLHPIAYEFENNYNLAPQETIMIGFELPMGHDRPDNDMQLSYNDQVFKNGIIKATFSEKDLNNIPKHIF